MLSRFHCCIGSNIILFEQNTIAYRVASFANGLTYSERPLMPGEIFLVEILEVEPGWRGHMRIGLTLVDPFKADARGIPPFSLPDLATTGHAWIFPVNMPRRLASSTSVNVLGSGLVVETPRGFFSKSLLKPQMPEMQRCIDVGSRIGVMYVRCPKKAGMAEMHIIINGVDQGAFTKDIPYGRWQLHAVVDVFGTTKQVQIVQVYAAKSLQAACRDIILLNLGNRSLEDLPLPKKMLDLLRS